MMTSNRIIPNYYYAPNEIVNRNNNKWENYSHIIPNNTGYITSHRKNGQYNITEKDFGDHKLLYYIPAAYENDYDISQLDETPIYDEQEEYHRPILVRRRYYQQYDDDNDHYIEKLPMIPQRRHVYVAPRRPQVIKRIYYEPPEPVEYIYEDDYRPNNEEINQYVVRDRIPRQRYIEEPQPIRQTVYVEDLPPISPSLRISPSIKPRLLNEQYSPRRSEINRQTPRITTIRQLSNRSIIQNYNGQKYLSLKEVVAQNRARRGSRIPKPRREVEEEEEKYPDPPKYKKEVIKYDCFVYK